MKERCFDQLSTNGSVLDARSRTPDMGTASQPAGLVRGTVEAGASPA
jgi:hypothetical protein